jgi:hypothetical protein
MTDKQVEGFLNMDRSYQSQETVMQLCGHSSLLDEVAKVVHVALGHFLFQIQ